MIGADRHLIKWLEALEFRWKGIKIDRKWT
jgi:hypothetical protein